MLGKWRREKFWKQVIFLIPSGCSVLVNHRSTISIENARQDEDVKKLTTFWVVNVKALHGGFNWN